MSGFVLRAGELNRRIGFERSTTTRDPMNAEIETWAPLVTVWTKVTFGTGQERRQAAQESGSVAATFRVRRTSQTAGVGIKDRIAFDGAAWDIISVVPFGRVGLDFTAVRAA